MKLTEEANLPLYFHFQNFAGHFFAEFSSSPTGAMFKTHCAYQNLLFQWLCRSFLPRVLKQAHGNISNFYSQTYMNRWGLHAIMIGGCCSSTSLPFLGSTGNLTFLFGNKHFSSLANLSQFFFFFLRFYLFILREEKGRRKRGRETSMCGCLSHAPYWGPGPQPRNVPWLGTEPTTLWFAGWHSSHWATPARAHCFLLNNFFWCVL